MIEFLVHFWGKIFPQKVNKRKSRFSAILRVSSLSLAEADLKKGALILIGTDEKYKWLRFICPCGCGEELALNLMKSHRPCWTVTSNDDATINVSPSVDATKCGAHFWIRRNTIEWCD